MSSEIQQSEIREEHKVVAQFLSEIGVSEDLIKKNLTQPEIDITGIKGHVEQHFKERLSVSQEFMEPFKQSYTNQATNENIKLLADALGFTSEERKEAGQDYSKNLEIAKNKFKSGKTDIDSLNQKLSELNNKLQAYDQELIPQKEKEKEDAVKQVHIKYKLLQEIRKLGGNAFDEGKIEELHDYLLFKSIQERKYFDLAVNNDKTELVMRHDDSQGTNAHKIVPKPVNDIAREWFESLNMLDVRSTETVNDSRGTNPAMPQNSNALPNALPKGTVIAGNGKSSNTRANQKTLNRLHQYRQQIEVKK